jgi:hemimethylated DNA binding protein
MALRRLKEMRSFLDRNSKDLEGDQIRFRQNNHPAHYALYNKDIVVKDNLITFPEIRDTNELRSVIRSVYWLNNEQTIANIENANDVGASSSSADDDQKGQISLAFEAIKSCNQLSSNELDSRRKKRESAIEVRNRKEGVVPLFHVGQVIKKKAKWRGVIVGWTVDEAKASSGQLTKNRLTSLTTKQYEIREAKGDAASYEDSISSMEATVKYTILVDMNDSSLLHTSKSISLESQEDLVPVDEPCLRRISSNLINQYFSHFDPSEGGYFAPNKVLKYMYPLDRFSDNGNEGIEEVIDSSPRNAKAGLFLSPEQQDACKAISNGIHDIGHRLLSPLLKLNTQQQNDENGVASLASALLSNLQAILQENERGISTPSSPLDSAISSIKRLDQFYAKLIALQWSHDLHKKHNKNNNNNIHFKLGQTVKHKLFNFRGVVTAWDPKPYVDVSQWDGLQGVDNPNEKPFYHIRTDTNDCIREFGSPRPYRYVCQDNLEPYDLKHGRIELEMELDKEEWGWDKENGWFVPSEEIKVRYYGNVLIP